MKGKKITVLLLLLLCGVQIWAQIPRSDEFHGKYRLSGVVVFSRHNIRAPLSAPGSFISRVTPYGWHDFGVNTAELTMKGAVLETINGQFFHKWVVSEGLFPENAEPSGDELYVLSNSMQRTIATARYFSTGFMPMKTVAVNHKGALNAMDGDFTLALGEDITRKEWKRIRAEYEAAYSPDDIREASRALQPVYDLLAEILDLRNSEAYADGSFTGFDNHNSSVVLAVGKEPSMGASLGAAVSVADALILQYYEEPDSRKAAFGRELTAEEWRMLGRVIAVRDEIRFSSPFVQRYVSRRMRGLIADALQNDGRKFTFLCGHDTNILNILKVLRTVDYDTPDAIESGTPVGSKIVFEKWTDAEGNAFIGVNHVYQTVEQLRNNTLLDLATPPDVIPLQFEGMTPNEDGLYPLEMMIVRLSES